jgi:membrane protease YdiL (CAAX protease family)
MILLGVVAANAASFVAEPLVMAFPSKWFEMIDQFIGTGGWSIMMAVVAAPVLEEIFCRGQLLEALARRWRPWVAVVASAAFFGIVHFNPPQAVNAFVIAVVMGYLYMVTRSLTPVIIIHAINNALAWLTLRLTGTQATDTRELIGNDTVYWAVYAVCAVILAASLVLMHRAVNTKTREIALNKKTTGDAE